MHHAKHKKGRYLFIALVLTILIPMFPVIGQTYSFDYTPENYDFSFYEAAESTEPLPLVSSRRFMVLPRKVKNIIYLVGDGMSYGQVAATRYQVLGSEGKLHFERFPVTANVYTHSANYLVTDSAAASTALATGFKTNSGMVGMTPEEEKVKSIMIAAQEQGKSTGLVATATVTHATPAGFAAHVPSRGQEADIAVDYYNYGIDVIFGGGTAHFFPASHELGSRSDERNLKQDFVDAGYQVALNRDELYEIDGKKALGLFSRGGLVEAEGEPTLAEITQKAIELLSQNKDGFFLHVEGSQIDWAAHAHDHERMYNETLHFDMAVKKAVDFAKEDGNTLVIVTADHETGGLTLLYTTPDEELNLSWSTGGHSGVPVPLYAYGPYAEKFTGTLHLTDIPEIMADILNINDFPKVLE